MKTPHEVLHSSIAPILREDPLLDTTTGALDLMLQPSHLAILLPTLGALLVLLFRSPNAVAAWIVRITGFLGLLAPAWLVWQSMRGGLRSSVPTVGVPISSAELTLPLQLHVTRLGILMACAVALVSLVVQMFGRWYLYNDPRYRSFAATVALFTAAMQLVVLSGDVVLTLIGWELMGWCSYVLIGHESERAKARRASYKAFLVTRLADAPFYIGLVALASWAKTTSIPGIIEFWSAHPQRSLTVALLCIVCGVAGKSALVPFQDWLADAMEGPTPASALIHAATMVAAGTYLVSVLHPLFLVAPRATLALAILAGITTVVGALLAFLQHDLKKLLAWSTVSQMGLMLTGLAGLPDAVRPDVVVLHLLAHAGFKALLFLMVGWLAVLVGGTIVERMSGAVTTHHKTRWLVGSGLLALAGIPPLFGFVSKDLIVDEVFKGVADGRQSSYVAAVALVLVIPLTAAYAMRAWLVLTHQTVLQRHFVMDVLDDSHSVQEVGLMDLLVEGEPVDEFGRPLRREPEPEPEPEVVLPRPPWPTRMGLGLLALISIGGGALILSPWLDIDYMHPQWLIVAAGLLAIAAAGLLVRALSVRTTFGDAASRLPLYLRTFASRGADVDRLYLALVARPVEMLAGVVARADAMLERGVRALGTGALTLATRSGRVHTGAPSVGLVALACGVVLAGVLGVTLW